ncbi:MAG: alpha-2-macroglobulin family protein [Rhizobiales bacterium]|nr:alpha-2-macroglobulin family protein [Hyphomicrobiales bacterium]MBI3673202.1 alpha-2-macroglobulin family protein [Hyphomicrobiales bacterium]
MASGYGRLAARPVFTLPVVLCLLLSLALLGLVPATAAAAKLFPVDSFSYYMSDYERDLAKLARTVDKPAAELQAELAAAETAGNARLAAVSAEKILSLDPRDGALWLKLAAYLSTAQPINDEDGYRLPSKLIGASLKAYLLAGKAPEEAKALAFAAQGFAKRENWRPALQAYKESLRLVENETNRQAYQKMREEHGFRITDYKIENDAVPPRACFQLSDPPSRTVTEFSSYFTQEPGPLSAVAVEGTRLCIEGLKYGERYHIVARQGLPAAADDAFAKDFEFDFYVRDRGPAVRFSGKSYVLPRTGQTGIPLVSVNSKSATLALYRIGDRNLIASVVSSNFRAQIDGYTARSIGGQQGAKVWRGTLETPSPLNQEATAAFPVDEALGKLAPGLYVMTARPTALEGNEYDAVATQWFVVSDLGVATLNGKDGLYVFIRSLASADPVPNVEVRLVARNNEVLAQSRSDAAGAVRFDPGLARGDGGQQPALIVASTAAGDYTFIDLTQPSFDLTDRGVAGRDPPGAIDAFVYAERGVYRRGETVHANALLRNDKANAMAGLPLVLVVERPDGMEYSRVTVADQGAGAHPLDIPINALAAGGTWRLKAYTDPKSGSVGETSFLVEDYVPDRIEFDLLPISPVASIGDGARLSVDGRYLFGAPGAGLDLEANISVAADDNPFPDWPGYRFGLTDERVDTVQNTAEGLPQTDIDGHADLALRLPELPSTTRPLKADVAVRMREPGGRAVEQTASLPVRAEQPLIGIRPSFDTGGAPQGQPAEFNVIAIDPDGKAIAATGATWSLKRLSTDYQWFNIDGSWRYESITRGARIGGGIVDITAKAPLHLAQTLSWGTYRLEFAARGFTPASVDFYAGYYDTSAGSADTPDKLIVALDRASVKAGDTLNLKVESRFAGKATIQVIGERLLASQEVDVPEGGTTVPIVVGEGWGTGAYAVATLYRPMDVQAKRMPARSVGVAWFGIDREARTLGVKLSAVAQMKPRQNLAVPVTIDGLAPNEEAFVTVAAVDVGILNLTRYKAPAPEAFYYDQKRLTAELRDLYGALIDGMDGVTGRIRSGGDSGAAFNAPPPSQPPLALFTGVVKVAADGSTTVSFDIPGFNGTVRLMAVAWTASKVGHAQADVIVRDPVVMAGTLPRFLAVGDRTRFRLDLINTEAPAGDYSVGVTVEGPLSADTARLAQKITLGPAGARLPVLVPIAAQGPGEGVVTARLIGPGNVVIEQTYNLHIVPANPAITRRTTLELAAHGGSITLTKDLFDGMVAGTTALALSVGPLPEIDTAGLLRDLDRYPYGCSEQTVSRALPLLYLGDLNAGKGVADADLKQRLKDSVTRLINRQGSNGAFGLWSPGEGDQSLWLSAFVTDFLLRAREKGYEVPEENLTAAIDYLRNSVGNAPDIERGKGQDVAYALYVLARAGKAPVGDLKYLADTKMAEFGSPLARAQMGAALAILGDKSRSDMAFAAAIDALREAANETDRGYRDDYGSVLRDSAAILALASEAKSGARVIKAATATLASERRKTQYASTQEMTWMVLAARALKTEARAIKLDVNGSAETGALYKLFAAGEFTGDYKIANPGDQPLRAVVAVSGSPTTPEPAASNGLTVSRAYYTPEGVAADPASVKQNTRLIVVLQVSAVGDERSGNFLLSDPLPAGFEIENPTLVSSGSTASLAWLQETGNAAHTEFRDERFIASFFGSSLKIAYMVRAIAPGTYVHPGVSVEDMYRLEFNARTASSTTVVTEP